MDLQLRLADLQDIPKLQDLIRASVTGLGAGFYSEQQIDSALVHIFGVDTQLIHDATYFVVEAGDQIVGAGGWSKRATLYGGDHMKSETVDRLLNPETEPARIRAFYVHPAWARKGIGGKILAACEAEARAAGFKRVELVSTLPGEPLYLAKGYCKREPMELKTSDGESLPAFRMTKEL